MAGVTNMVSLSITTAPAAILDKSILEMTSDSGLMYRAMTCGTAMVTSLAEDKEVDAEYSIELPDEVPEQSSKMSSR